MGLKKTILAALLEYVVTNAPTEFEGVTNVPSISPSDSTIAPTTPPTSAQQEAIAGHFAMGTDYRLLERSVCTWNTADLVPERKFPVLGEIYSVQAFCPVMISEYVFPVIGRIGNTEVNAAGISTARRADRYQSEDLIHARKRTTVRQQDVQNLGFFGAEVIGYSDDDRRVLTAQNELDSDDLINMFRYVLNVAWRRKPRMSYIVYSGESNALIDELIKTVNMTVPVVMNLDTALKYAMQHYFNNKYPQLVLDANGCPIGQQSKMRNLQLSAFECTKGMPIHGISTDPMDYGVKFGPVSTNRWFSMQISALTSYGDVAEFNMTFSREGLTVQADGKNHAIVAPHGLPRGDEDNTTTTIIKFPYKQLIDSKPYMVRLTPEILPFGLKTQVLNVDIRQNGEPDFENIASFQMHGQPRHLLFCGFSPRTNRKGVKNAKTTIDEVESLLMNTGFKTKPALG